MTLQHGENMKTKNTPEWAIAKINGIRAEKFFAELRIVVTESKRAYLLMNQAYKMTNNKGFTKLAQNQIDKLNAVEKLIEENANLYYILTKGYSLN
jgi:hypothetical protein